MHLQAEIAQAKANQEALEQVEAIEQQKLELERLNMERSHRAKQQQLELTNKAERLKRQGHQKGLEMKLQTINEESEDNLSNRSSDLNPKTKQTTARDTMCPRPTVTVAATQERLYPDISGLWDISQVPPELQQLHASRQQLAQQHPGRIFHSMLNHGGTKQREQRASTE